jgi:hypothetical protein
MIKSTAIFVHVHFNNKKNIKFISQHINTYRMIQFAYLFSRFSSDIENRF